MRLSKEEFVQKALRHQKQRKEESARKAEREITAYLAEQQGKRKYALSQG